MTYLLLKLVDEYEIEWFPVRKEFVINKKIKIPELRLFRSLLLLRGIKYYDIIVKSQM